MSLRRPNEPQRPVVVRALAVSLLGASAALAQDKPPLAIEFPSIESKIYDSNWRGVDKKAAEDKRWDVEEPGPKSRFETPDVDLGGDIYSGEFDASSQKSPLSSPLMRLKF